MGAPNFTMGLMLGDTFVDDQYVVYCGYGAMWDRGSRMNLLINDPNGTLLRAIETMKDADPTPAVTFQFEWLPSQNQPYKNKGEQRKLYVLRAGAVTTPDGICLRLTCVDLAYLLLRRETSAFHAHGVKANRFVLNYLDKVGIAANIPDTGDVAGAHRALHGRPLAIVRYELDRVLSQGGKPLSLQFDDSVKGQKLLAFEEDGHSDLIESYTGGTYITGTGQAGATFGNAAYHFEMDQTFESVLWGHRVSANHLTTDNALVSGSVKSTMADQLGVKGKLSDKAHRRIVLPRSTSDNPTSDDYYANAAIRNQVYHARMSATSGMMVVDPDFKAFDGVKLLNRNHVQVMVGGSASDSVGNAIVPQQSVVMGYQHVITRERALTKVHLRRGDK